MFQIPTVKRLFQGVGGIIELISPFMLLFFLMRS